ncbi:hypothetical protein [Zhouia amylolytica]|uniref:Uncharacterized protein n=1 Tax=Zhouia amylolytica AD3 TaxID=1286632 RepID=W2UTI4_9FLAO|nr:hypothetical protein [Zhouia amylolytica]ETN96826.1 hypothetical protein P278_02520 [Zhouia amylolytica AD3]
MKKAFFKALAKLNKVLLPSFTKQRLDVSKAKKWQLRIYSLPGLCYMNVLIL